MSDNFYLSSSPPDVLSVDSNVDVPELEEEQYENELEGGESDWESDSETAHLEEPQTPTQGQIPLPSSSGPYRSSPVVGTQEEIRNIRRRKSNKQRAQTMAAKQLKVQEANEATRIASLQEVIDVLHSKNLRLWDLLEYIFNPANHQGVTRYNDFFIQRSRSAQVLEWWLSPDNRSKHARADVKKWIEKYAVRKVSKEARTVTTSKKLQTIGNNIDSKTVKNFDLSKINRVLKHESTTGAPFTMRLLESFSTSRHVAKHSENRRQKTNMVRGIPFWFHQ